MVFTRTVLCLAIMLATGAVQAEDASRISRVTLYPGSATVERVAHVAAGAGRLEIGGLPANFDIQTIRIESDGGIRLGEFSVLDVARTEAINPRQSELENRILALGNQIAQLDVERQSAELVTGYLKGLGESSDEASPHRNNDTRNLAATLEAIRRGGSDALGRIQRVAVQKRALEQQLAALQRDLARITESNRDSRKLVLTLAAERGGDVRMSYQVNGPGWQPTYRATLDSASGKVELVRQALIAQNSGEDWSNVALRLSTGQPRAAVQGQEPRPWLLALREPQPLAKSYAPMMAMAAAPAPVARSDARARERAEPLFEVAELQNMYATEFEVPAKISLPSDSRKITVQLTHQSIPVNQRVQVLPRQDTTAYLIASAARPQGVWLPGEIQLYRDDTYVGASRWNAQDGEQLELPFGRDDLVHVSVAHNKATSGSAGIIGSRRERQIADTYSVTSQHRQAVELLLLEPSPVSNHEDLKVEKTFTPKPTKEDWDDKNGVAAWQTTLPAGGSVKFSVDYRITWPKEDSVTGLP